MMDAKQNRLAQEASLYLRQHATNPVAWYPWGREAFTAATHDNKPVLLSIGYSACHWCHVMAQESFADPATAKIMNEFFISIKVDREERPDLDKIYQLVHQIMTGRGGGWPLTVFLTPENRMPFFVGTYFPETPRYGMPGFKEVLLQIKDYFHEQGAAIKEQNDRLSAALNHLSIIPAANQAILDDKLLVVARNELLNQFDPVNGGFGAAPKFPNPTNIERLLRVWIRSQYQGQEDNEAKLVVQTTLQQMAEGGIYDQLGGGFYRYSVDERWQIPHFEKMLYDNAQLLTRYAEAGLLLADPGYKKIVEETAAWIMREMRDEMTGGYYATLDADSEHVEGKFYYWDREQFRALLTDDEYAVATHYFGLTATANFEHHWHLHVAQDIPSIATQLTLDQNIVAQYLQTARIKLWQTREQRIRPGRDEKILVAWNSLLIKGLALAGLLLERDDLIVAAQQIVDFIQQKLWRDNRLLACYQQGHGYLNAYLDDYAFLLDALLVLLQVRWRSKDLIFACALAETLLQYFADEQEGGFFFTANDHETLIQRQKSFMDEAIPAGNGVAAQGLAKLGHLLGEPKYLLACEKTLRAAWSSLQVHPTAYNSLLNALEDFLYPPQIIVLRGSETALLPWQAVCRRNYLPQRLLLAIPSAEKELPGVLAACVAHVDKVVAYVCRGVQCSPAITELTEFESQLANPF